MSRVTLARVFGEIIGRRRRRRHRERLTRDVRETHASKRALKDAPPPAPFVPCPLRLLLDGTTPRMLRTYASRTPESYEHGQMLRRSHARRLLASDVRKRVIIVPAHSNQPASPVHSDDCGVQAVFVARATTISSHYRTPRTAI